MEDKFNLTREQNVFCDKPKDYLFTNFNEFYLKILDYFKDSDKTIVIE